jgi:hypothetical protein
MRLFLMSRPQYENLQTETCALAHSFGEMQLILLAGHLQIFDEDISRVAIVLLLYKHTRKSSTN